MKTREHKIHNEMYRNIVETSIDLYVFKFFILFVVSKDEESKRLYFHFGTHSLGPGNPITLRSAFHSILVL